MSRFVLGEILDALTDEGVPFSKWPEVEIEIENDSVDQSVFEEIEVDNWTRVVEHVIEPDDINIECVEIKPITLTTGRTIINLLMNVAIKEE